MKRKIIISSLAVLFAVCFLISAGAEGVDWRQFEGETINLLMNRHTYTNSLVAYTDEFTELTGINVNLFSLPEQQFFERQKMVLATGSDEYDISMIGPLFIWEYIPFLEPLDQFIEDPALTEPSWGLDDLQNFDDLISLGKELRNELASLLSDFLVFLVDIDLSIQELESLTLKRLR